jgi:hypothetical protein
MIAAGQDRTRVASRLVDDPFLYHKYDGRRRFATIWPKELSRLSIRKAVCLSEGGGPF